MDRDRLIETNGRLADAVFSLAERSKQQTGVQVKTNDLIHSQLAEQRALAEEFRAYLTERRLRDEDDAKFQLWTREQMAVLVARVKDIDDDTGTFKVLVEHETRHAHVSAPPPEGKVWWLINVWRKMPTGGKVATIVLIALIALLAAHYGLHLLKVFE